LIILVMPLKLIKWIGGGGSMSKKSVTVMYSSCKFWELKICVYLQDMLPWFLLSLSEFQHRCHHIFKWRVRIQFASQFFFILQREVMSSRVLPRILLR
jgi:hypothetical protein